MDGGALSFDIAFDGTFDSALWMGVSALSFDIAFDGAFIGAFDGTLWMGDGEGNKLRVIWVQSSVDSTRGLSAAAT